MPILIIIINFRDPIIEELAGQEENNNLPPVSEQLKGFLNIAVHYWGIGYS